MEDMCGTRTLLAEQGMSENPFEPKSMEIEESVRIAREHVANSFPNMGFPDLGGGTIPIGKLISATLASEFGSERNVWVLVFKLETHTLPGEFAVEVNSRTGKANIPPIF